MTENEKRKKVTKGLGCCLSAHTPECSYCPYDSIDLRCRSMLREDVMELLKAQEPVEPVYGGYDRDIKLACCGACGGEIGAWGIAHFCMGCGKAVKWSE